MPKPKTDKEPRLRSPFKDVVKFENELKSFSNRFKITIAEHSKRVSDYFEISCFNMIVRYYELNGYLVVPQNIIGKKYRYKCTTSGIQSNFSHFNAGKKFGNRFVEFDIHHNLAVQSSQDPQIFTTPDVVVTVANSVRYRNDYYDTKQHFRMWRTRICLLFAK